MPDTTADTTRLGPGHPEAADQPTGRRDVRAFVPSHDVPLEIRDLGDAGLTVESPASFPPGDIVAVEFVVDGHEPVTVVMKSVHCHLTAPRNGAQFYLTGFEPLQETDATLYEGVLESRLQAPLPNVEPESPEPQPD